MIKKTKAVLKKHVATVHCENNVSLLQRKLFNALLFNAYDELLTQERHQIGIGELCSLIGYKGYNYDAIKIAIKALIGTVIEWNLMQDRVEEWAASALLASANFKNGVCFYSYSPDIKTFLHSPKIYASINMSIQSKFTSSYALALYENCVRYKELYSTGWFDISLFRKLMGVPQDKYLAFGDFKKRVLDKALEEINEYSDIKLKIEFRKKGRAVHSLRFLIEERRAGHIDTVNLPTIEGIIGLDEEKDEVLKKLIGVYGLSRNVSKDLFAKYERHYVLEKINLIESGVPFQTGRIKNLSAYLLQALQENYQAPKSSIEILNQKRAEQEELEKQKRLDEKRKEEQTQAYHKYRESFLDNLLNNMDREGKQNLENEFRHHLENTSNFFVMKLYKKQGLHDLIVHAIFKAFVMDHYPKILCELLTQEEFLASL